MQTIGNKLSFHLGKTESILFGSKIKLSIVDELNVAYDGKNNNSIPAFLAEETQLYK